ncbi:glycoside hydrolase family 32 protein [Plebeiibacterium marinum]|uniref:Glycoside hydrolase family 32 protein n=1 Tax=Plebeiibacterium marinum TaxID=2992111 RepID=A0AAE3MBS7_9BACT|nr:glycoside hydrolase family 32 protein [Plebeiobacterium marinum]MCW3804556.1 glycoside hydrolase family 32 protein [Plebeiobacterium marinum]
MKNIITVFLIILSFVSCVKKHDQKKYTEQYRPQIHFSLQSGWANDPNGMVYYDGEYHLFFQYNPDTTIWGPMHWGHAISKDLIHWEELPIALYPDSLGWIFSGSAVIDWENTSGLGKNGIPPMVAIFTYHNRELESAGTDKFQYQGIAYSLDKGRTWTKYKNNPVLPNPGIRDFRDPKVSWHPESGKWIMTLAVLDHINFYSSPNLIDWTLESEFGVGIGAHGGVWECPDLFPLQIEGTDETKWVLLVSINPGGPNGGSATQYFIGDFDGHVFEPHGEKTKWLDYGKDNYAGVTWSDIPDEDGRRILIGWMNNWQYANEIPTSGWRGVFTLPRTLELTEIYNDYLMISSPVKEFEKLKSGSKNISGSTISGMQEINMKPQFPMEIDLNFNTENNTAMNFGERFGIILSNKKNESLKIGYDNLNKLFFIDRSNCGWDSPNQEFAGIHNAPYIVSSPSLDLKLIIDESSVELFAVDGLVSMTEQLFTADKFTSVCLFSQKGEVELIGGSISNLSSIW